MSDLAGTSEAIVVAAGTTGRCGPNVQPDCLQNVDDFQRTVASGLGGAWVEDPSFPTGSFTFVEPSVSSGVAGWAFTAPVGGSPYDAYAAHLVGDGTQPWELASGQITVGVFIGSFCTDSAGNGGTAEFDLYARASTSANRLSVTWGSDTGGAYLQLDLWGGSADHVTVTPYPYPTALPTGWYNVLYAWSGSATTATVWPGGANQPAAQASRSGSTPTTANFRLGWKVVGGSQFAYALSGGIRELRMGQPC